MIAQSKVNSLGFRIPVCSFPPSARVRVAGHADHYSEAIQEGKWRIEICGIFCSKLEKEGELKRISAEVDPVLEITEITDRAVKAGGPALLFERPRAREFRW